ncbi:MAG: 50S ribosomal protein L17 [Candidatus Kerfeldbacteria bacterium]|nr:50S ribosomal protein L17 [Candidatus Kerfeldbacteria bacterium]
MRHRKAKRTLDRTSAQRQRLLRNLAVALIINGRITTTPARAKLVRRFVERLISTGKQPTLVHRRQLLQALPHRPAVQVILQRLAPQFQRRAGGYTRRSNLGRRAGDGAEQVKLEFIE